MEPSQNFLKKTPKNPNSLLKAWNELVSFSLQEKIDYVRTAFKYKQGWEKNT